MNNDFMAAVKRATDHAREVGAIKSIRTEASTIQEDNIPFTIRVVENLARKERNAAANPANPFLPYDEDLFVADISDTHLCLLNKFNVVDDHLLFVTKQFESQQSLLTSEDFEALWFGLKAMNGLVFFNSCETAGASQKHKHLQMIPCPIGVDGDSVPVAAAFHSPKEDEVICRSDELPFAHVYAKIDPPNGRSNRECADHLRELYLAMLQTLRLWQPKAPESIQPYNLLASREWLWLVPRAEPQHQGISVNALGFAGTCLLKNTAQLELLREIGLMALLAAVSG
ncbi:MAG: hypothetical protein MI867_03350 [Pseudomonadales bacterium]|nr:hypothetical protein [Pseudomonadales bacterium]